MSHLEGCLPIKLTQYFGYNDFAEIIGRKGPFLNLCHSVGEEELLAYMHFPAPHRTKLHPTNLIERLHGEVKRRTDFVGILPNEAAVVRLLGAILLAAACARTAQ